MSAHQSQHSEQMNITNIWNDFIKNKKIIKNLAKKMKNLDKNRKIAIKSSLIDANLGIDHSRLIENREAIHGIKRT
jgi:hypothetical protein